MYGLLRCCRLLLPPRCVRDLRQPLGELAAPGGRVGAVAVGAGQEAVALRPEHALPVVHQRAVTTREDPLHVPWQARSEANSHQPAEGRGDVAHHGAAVLRDELELAACPG